MTQLEVFLKELTELTKKHNIECGCCGSPALYCTKENKTIAEGLRYEVTADAYSTEGDWY